MRILVLSDTHGSLRNIERAIEAQPEADHIIFCGDGLSDIEKAEDYYPDKTFHKVRGNCDWYANETEADTIVLGGKKIFFTHGHRYGVKGETGAIVEAAMAREVDVLLFGHTHQPYQNYFDGLYVMNPGSASAGSLKSSYGYIDITPQGIMTNIVYY